jgi:hypothetical protein
MSSDRVGRTLLSAAFALPRAVILAQSPVILERSEGSMQPLRPTTSPLRHPEGSRAQKDVCHSLSFEIVRSGIEWDAKKKAQAVKPAPPVSNPLVIVWHIGYT